MAPVSKFVVPDPSPDPVKVGEEIVYPRDFYTIEQTERILGMCRASIDRRVRANLLQRSGTARKILYKGQHILDYLDSGM